MRKKMTSYFMVLCCGAFLAGGCAKKEMVKGDEQISGSGQQGQAGQAGSQSSGDGTAGSPRGDGKPSTISGEPMTGPGQGGSEATLIKIFFDFDAYVLSQSSRDSLNQNAAYLLKKNPSAKIQIEGHCDERGTDEYNLALGEKRAKAALDYLVTLGVPVSRLSFISYGKEKPADPGHDETAWTKNRRDEFMVIK